MSAVIQRLLWRAERHDHTKLSDPIEKAGFDRARLEGSGIKYTDPAYEERFKGASLKEAVERHYMHNAHHPEHWAHPAEMPASASLSWFDPEMVLSGEAIARMSLLDIQEMCCDWYAANKRTGGDFAAGLIKSRDRFGIEPQLFAVMVNFFKEMHWIAADWQATEATS